MKFTTEELLLAEAVRARVEQMRLNRLALLPPEQKQQFMNAPVDALIAEALNELQNFAIAIAQIQSRDSSR